ncbi:hypothetical protein Enr13x_11040 [Stieleria neptunia]|uniref:Tetratricopeptide repeat protein n=1 Tax=Stieleria neptunia TaxID=2527979 RepID=A0A518HKA3_9BACT|nr:hypothetical protein [Stieleria neptunia]QDV41266.1 hypothetical protein Enr13x_11040 [Stieleria neptunia]
MSPLGMAGLMAPRRRRRCRLKPSDGTAAITLHQSDEPPPLEPSRASSLLGRWLVPLGTGMLLGAAILAVARPVFVATDADQDSVGEGLLKTQQLDSLFRVIESQLQEDSSHLASYRKLLDTFLVYDRQYVAQASVNPATRLAKAYAAKRIGHCYQAIGELEGACEYYRQSRDLFGACLQADPKLVELYSLWLNAHAQIAYVEFARGNVRSAESEFRTALHVLQESTLVPDFEYHNSLFPELKLLAQLGLELKLYAESLQVAERLALSAKKLTDRSPQDAELARDAVDAERYLNLVSSLLAQQGNQ